MNIGDNISLSRQQLIFNADMTRRLWVDAKGKEFYLTTNETGDLIQEYKQV